MFGTQHLGLFISAGLLLNMAPGPDTMYILGRTLAQGRSAGIASVLGISTGCLVHTLAAGLGLSAILVGSALAFSCVKLVGAGYLIYLGIALLRKGKAADIPSGFVTKDAWAIYRQAVITNVLNPKVALFFLAFLPQFVARDPSPRFLSFLFLGSVFILNGTLYCLCLVQFASVLNKRLRKNATIGLAIRRMTGAVFVGLGVRLATQSRS
jgi:threonine/homoserine/homoserine lactone efflux protein